MPGISSLSINGKFIYVGFFFFFLCLPSKVRGSITTMLRPLLCKIFLKFRTWICIFFLKALPLKAVVLRWSRDGCMCSLDGRILVGFVPWCTFHFWNADRGNCKHKKLYFEKWNYFKNCSNMTMFYSNLMKRPSMLYFQK